VAALAVILLLGFFLRCWQIQQESPWWDETVALEPITAPSLVEFIRLERSVDPPMTPVYFTLAYAWSRLTSTSVDAMRMLSVLFGLGSVVTIFFVGKRLYNAATGLIAAAGLALSMPHIYYSQEVRVYALVTLLALLSMLFFIQALQNGRRLHWLLHGVANFLLIFTHLFAVYLLAAQWVYLLIYNRRALRMWTLAHGSFGLLLFLWLQTVDLSNIDQAAHWIVQPGLRELGMLLLIFAGGRPSNENPASHLPSGLSLDIPLALMMAGLAALLVVSTAWPKVAGSRFRDKAFSRSTVLLLLWGVVPFAALVIMSFVWRPCFVPRYILYASLPLYLMMAAALANMTLRKTAIGTAIILLLLSIHQLSAITTGPFRPDWRAVSRHLEQKTAPQDTVVAFQGINAEALRYNSSLNPKQIERVDVWSAICGAVMTAQQQGDAYVVVWLWSDPSNIESYFRDNNLAFSHKDFAGWPPLRVYHLPAKEEAP